MVTMGLSWDQIQKVKDKTVKESILAEMQTRYSRNLWSSSFWWIIYNRLDVELSTWSNWILFSYYTWNNSDPFSTGYFEDNFEIKYIVKNYNNEQTNPEWTWNVILNYTPYKVFCRIWEDYSNVVIITRINDSKDYCFEIKQKNCRLIELSEENCDHLKNILN